MKKIMIVDDELNVTELLERFLSKENLYTISSFASSKNALEEISKNKYDLVLTDVMMPLVSGLNILSEIKKISPNTKVILMTAYSTDKKKEESELLHADGYIEKPFKSLKFVEEVIHATLNRL